MAKKHLLTLCFMTASAHAYAAELCDLEENYLHTIDGKVQQHWGRMDKVWPGTDYSKDLLMLRLNPKNPTCVVALQLGQKPKKLVGKDLQAYLKMPIKGMYYPIELNGHKGITLFKPAPQFPFYNDPNVAFEIATHEQSHFIYQQDFIKSTEDDDSDRFSTFPAKSAPRVIRHQLITRIIDYLEAISKGEDGKTQLGQAAYWHQKHKHDFPEEAKKAVFTDLAEGMATYINIMVNYNGVKDGLQSNLVTRLREDLKTRHGLDSESYTLGAAAGAALDVQDKAWKTDFLKTKITPAERLLKGIKPIEDKADETILTRLTEKTNAQNKAIETSVKPYMNALNDDDQSFLRIDAKFGGATNSDFAKYQGHKLMTDLSVTMQTEAWKLDIIKTTTEVIEDGDASYYQVPISGSFVSMEEDGKKMGLFDLDQLKGKALISGETKENNGQRIIWVK